MNRRRRISLLLTMSALAIGVLANSASAAQLSVVNSSEQYIYWTNTKNRSGTDLKVFSWSHYAFFTTDEAEALVDSSATAAGCISVTTAIVQCDLNSPQLSGRRIVPLVMGGTSTDAIDVEDADGRFSKIYAFGMDGNDTINGASATSLDFEYLAGGDGTDTIDGNEGNDIIDGGNENDTLHGDSGNDTISVGANTNVTYGAYSMDRVEGGSGNDTVDLDNGVFDHYVFLDCGSNTDNVQIDSRDVSRLSVYTSRNCESTS